MFNVLRSRITILLSLFLILSYEVPAQNQPVNTKIRSTIKFNWAQKADSAQVALITHFWKPDSAYFVQDTQGNTRFNYWWQAHALDVLADGYERTKKPEYLARMRALHDGIRLKNNNTFVNDFYDDMEWLALACLRAYQITQDTRFKNTAEFLWNDIKTGWSNELGGGISWQKKQRYYKNTPANAPASILASRLYRLTKRPEDLEWSKKIFAWQQKNLVDPTTSLVWDGMNRQQDGKIDKDWRFTYCQGVYIGAALELYQLTGEATYLQQAVKTADYVLADPHFSPNGLLRNEGKGDAGLFKGIFVRYLTQLIKEKNLDKEARQRYAHYLQSNGASLWQKATQKPAVLFSTNWAAPPAPITDCSTQLSGNMLLEALAYLQQANYIP